MGWASANPPLVKRHDLPLESNSSLSMVDILQSLCQNSRRPVRETASLQYALRLQLKQPYSGSVIA